MLFSTQLTNNFNVEENIIKVTNEHPFFVNGKWIEAKDLKVSDELLTADGKKARITNINDVEGEVQVYNLEVEEDNSYVTSSATVHNCMTPWFGIFGSDTGFDTLKDCFLDMTGEIYAIESGMSANPEMLWRFQEFIDGKINIAYPWSTGLIDGAEDE